MMGFAIGATLMVGVTLLLLLLPFRRRPAGTDFSRQQLNAAIYRDQFAELERDRSDGALSQADYEQARGELQRRLLEDSSAASADIAPTATTSRTVPTVLALALPLGAVLLYLILGSPAALNPQSQEKQFSQDDIERMVSGLAAKLEKEPENYKGWAMLARSYKSMGRFPEAVRAYERTGPMLDTSAELLVDYADTLAASVGGFSPKVNGLIDKALKIDPTSAQGLWMRGTASFEGKQYGKAIADWQRLLALLEPGSEDARVVEGNIAEAQDKGGIAKSAPKVGGQKGSPSGTGKTANVAVKGRIELAPNLSGQIPAGGILMVVARPNDGSRMPIAVLRAPAAQPFDFVLDDSLSLTPDRPLSSFSEVLVEARISKSGQAVPQAGDLFGPAVTAKRGADRVKLRIDQVRQ
jgi:cytochrome c-type biogenesis protein CcmH